MRFQDHKKGLEIYSIALNMETLNPLTWSAAGRVTLHLKRKTERNPTIVILCMDVGENVWCYSRHLKHIGVNPSAELIRPMTMEEFKRESPNLRFHSYPYRTWLELIRDEWCNTENEEWCTKLIELAELKLTLLQILENSSK